MNRICVIFSVRHEIRVNFMSPRVPKPETPSSNWNHGMSTALESNIDPAACSLGSCRFDFPTHASQLLFRVLSCVSLQDSPVKRLLEKLFQPNCRLKSYASVQFHSNLVSSPNSEANS